MNTPSLLLLSFVYSLRYMAFHVLQADIAAARSIAERALRTIDFREEEEKMNLWIAYVNLEHKYDDTYMDI